jgi:hypothetical protein
METPFGKDASHVAFEKMMRRLDKHTAAQLGRYAGKPSINYDVFPETRVTDAQGAAIEVSTSGSHSVYDLAHSRAKLAARGRAVHKQAASSRSFSNLLSERSQTPRSDDGMSSTRSEPPLSPANAGERTPPTTPPPAPREPPAP